MAHQEPKLDWEEESITEKLLRKAKTSPFLVIGKFKYAMQFKMMKS